MLWACNDPQQTDLLFRAEQMLESSPDSSLMLLKEIDPEQLNRAQHASYALLYTEACDKNGEKIISDSLLNVALEYYGKKGNSVALAKCYYYLGCYHWELEEWDKAVSSYGYAESVALDFSAYNLLGLIYGRLGRLYTQQFNVEKALDMYSRSVCCYDKVGNQKIKHGHWEIRGGRFYIPNNTIVRFVIWSLQKNFIESNGIHRHWVYV